jgi:hypothetical protein
MPLLDSLSNLDKGIVQALSCLSTPVLTAESFIEKDALQLQRDLTIPIHQFDEFRMSLLRQLSPPFLQPNIATSPSQNIVIPSSSSSSSSSSFNSAFQLRSVYSEVNMNIGCCSQSLNDLLGGGILMNEITELVGSSGVGKVYLFVRPFFLLLFFTNWFTLHITNPIPKFNCYACPF